MGDWMRKDERKSNTRENIGWDGWRERRWNKIGRDGMHSDCMADD